MLRCSEGQIFTSNGTELRSSQFGFDRSSSRSVNYFPSTNLLQHWERAESLQSYGPKFWRFIICQYLAFIYLELGQIYSHILSSTVPILSYTKADYCHFVNNLDYSINIYSYPPCGDYRPSRLSEFLRMYQRRFY